GIRDFHVTGVQTCALPIFARYRGRRYSPLANGQERARRTQEACREATPGLSRGNAHRRSDRWWRRSLRLERWIEVLCRAEPPQQIGRASCRGRAYVTVGVG